MDGMGQVRGGGWATRRGGASQASTGAPGEGRGRGERMVAYAIVERGQKSFWVRCGIAFQNRDGSWNVRLDALPVSGEMQLRAPQEDDARPNRSGGGFAHEDVGAEAFG